MAGLKHFYNESKHVDSFGGLLGIERRNSPRYSIEFPLTYSVSEDKSASHWGLARDASEGGILVYLKKNLKIGTILRIEIYYPGRSAIGRIGATARVVWSDLAAKDSFSEYRYGLQLESIKKRDFSKLRSLLRNCRNFVKTAGRISGSLRLIEEEVDSDGIHILRGWRSYSAPFRRQEASKVSP